MNCYFSGLRQSYLWRTTIEIFPFGSAMLQMSEGLDSASMFVIAKNMPEVTTSRIFGTTMSNVI
jgi:hypothetical protein